MYVSEWWRVHQADAEVSGDAGVEGRRIVPHILAFVEKMYLLELNNLICSSLKLTRAFTIKKGCSAF